MDLVERREVPGALEGACLLEWQMFGLSFVESAVLMSQSKINEYDALIEVNHDVVWLNVAVDIPRLMKKADCS